MNEEELEEIIGRKREECQKWRENRDKFEERNNEVNELFQPDVPVMSMGTKQIESFFPKFIRSVYSLHKMKIKNLWAKTDKKTGKVSPAEPPCPDWHPDIIDPMEITG